MQFKIRCVCGQCYASRSEFAGKQMRCRQCRLVFTIPHPKNKQCVHADVFDSKLDQVMKSALQFSTSKPSDAFDAAVSSAGIPQAGAWEDELDTLEQRALRENLEAKTVKLRPSMTTGSLKSFIVIVPSSL